MATIGAFTVDDFGQAQIVARNWHGGRDVHITGLSHGCDWTAEGLAAEIDALLRGAPWADDLRALREWADAQVITSVWSSYGHRFISDGEGHGSCLVCGAVYQLVHTGLSGSSGMYTAACGAEPEECSGDTSMYHGDDCAQLDDCAHCHPCRCLLCW